MNQEWVRDYLERYLEINNCQIIEKKPTHITAKLSTEIDKDLTNRPYYWTFVERTGAEPETLTMTYIFDREKLPQEIRGEEISLGSPRFKQIFNSANKRGKAVRLYQQYQANMINQHHPKTLSPWLLVNYKVELICDKKKDLVISLGINLANGKLKENFFNPIRNTKLGPVLPANVLTERAFLTLREATIQLEEKILHVISIQDFSWVYDAYDRLHNELRQLDAYYMQSDNNFEREKKMGNNLIVEKEKRVEEIKWQYSPRIHVAPINFGIFYLDENIIKNVEYIQ